MSLLSKFNKVQLLRGLSVWNIVVFIHDIGCRSLKNFDCRYPYGLTS